MTYECATQQRGHHCSLYDSIRVDVEIGTRKGGDRYEIKVDGHRVTTVTTGEEAALLIHGIHMGRHLEAQAWRGAWVA